MPRKPKAPAKSTHISSVKHKDKRTNIPTQELRDFVRDEEAAPKTILYPRDRSLDPQLVWKGKDEQDRHDLAIPAVPIYIQEKIQPQVIIEDLRAQAITGAPTEALELFSDFNGIAFEELVDFYHHEQNWTNRMILGDSLLVMTSLAEKEGLRGKVQTIYFDPPYGIKFGSNWQVSTAKREVADGKAADVTRQPEQIRAFRDTWQLGIHSYLSYLRDRLVVARDLLTDTGSIFVQIGDANVHLVRALLDEVFGSDNLVVSLVVKKKGSQKSGLVDPVNDFVLWYSKQSRNDNSGGPKFRPLLEPWGFDRETLSEFKFVELPDGRTFPVAKTPDPDGHLQDYRRNPQMLRTHYPDVRLYRANPLTSGGIRANQSLPFAFAGHEFSPPPGGCWKHTARRTGDTPSGMERLAWAGRLIPGGRTWRFKSYLDDFGYKPLSNWWDSLGGAADPIYVVETNKEIVKRCLLMSSDPGDLVLDPTCGSGTTAFVAEEWGRRWITIDTSRVALALARTRVMAARYPYYLLEDSDEGARKEAAIGALSHAPRAHAGDIRQGFVHKRIAHVSSGAIANNPEICEGMSHADAQLAISRHADSDLLFDQPYRAPHRVRVAGPFTVESLSPHRVLSADAPATASVRGTQGGSELPAQFETMVLDNLRRAGVQNTMKDERLQFEQLEPVAGRWLQAIGSYTDRSGSPKRVAVSIGPEHGTVDRDLIKEAAKEAVQGTGVDLLLVCGFAFGPEASETAGEYAKQAASSGKELMVADASRQFGRLQVLLTRMNPDLQNDELLKKTGAANLFMVFGEPDITIERETDGRVVVEIRGLDVYDPTTGEIRSHSTDQIACWFIDTDYNGESFFVRRAYFTGADEPYDKLKRALRSEIDEDAWSNLYSTRSQPFVRPAGGKIAIKVINHYGDEVLKVLVL